MTIFEKYILSHFNKITLIPEHVRHNLSIAFKKKKRELLKNVVTYHQYLKQSASEAEINLLASCKNEQCCQML